MIQKHYIVYGIVQGVGFRFFVEREATQLGLKGFVKNLEDGRVEIVVLAADENLLNNFKEKLLKGNGHSKVEKIDEREIKEDYDQFKFRGFQVLY